MPYPTVAPSPPVNTNPQSGWGLVPDVPGSTGKDKPPALNTAKTGSLTVVGGQTISVGPSGLSVDGTTLKLGSTITLGSIPVILQTSDLIIGGAHVPLTSGPANPTENPTVNPTAHPTANPTISPASTTSLIAQLTDGTSTTSVTFVPTSYSAYSDLSTTLTTQTTDSGHHTVPIVIGPHGRGWVCILCAGGGGGSFHWPGPIPFPKFAPPCIGNCGGGGGGGGKGNPSNPTSDKRTTTNEQCTSTKTASDCSVFCSSTGSSSTCYSTKCYSTVTGCSAIGTTITTGPPKSTAPTEKYQPFILDEEIPVNAAAVDSLASAMTFPSTTDTSGAGTSTTSNPSSSPTCNRMSNVGPDPNFANSLAAIFCDTSKTDFSKDASKVLAAKDLSPTESIYPGLSLRFEYKKSNGNCPLNCKDTYKILISACKITFRLRLLIA